MRTALLLLVAAACAPAYQPSTPNPHASEPIGSVREVYDGTLTPELAVNTFRNIDRLFPTRVVRASQSPVPLLLDPKPLVRVSFSDRGTAYDLESYLDLNRVTGLLVLKEGRVKLERYLHGNTDKTRWMSMSVAKSITATLVGAAIWQGRLSLSDQVVKHVPALAGSAYDGVTVRDVLMMASGARWNETYTDPRSDRRQLLGAQISQVPGSAMAVMKALPRVAPPGTMNNYNTGETQVAGEIVRNAVGKSLSAYLEDRVWTEAGMESNAIWWLDSPDGVEIGGSGFSATLRDYGRFGLFVLNDGMARGQRFLPEGWMKEASSPKLLQDGAPLAYGYLWWPVMTPAGRRDGAYEAMGIYGQHIYVNPAERVVIVAWSAQAKPVGAEVVSDWAFFESVVAAVR